MSARHTGRKRRAAGRGWPEIAGRGAEIVCAVPCGTMPLPSGFGAVAAMSGNVRLHRPRPALGEIGPPVRQGPVLTGTPPVSRRPGPTHAAELPGGARRGRYGPRGEAACAVDREGGTQLEPLSHLPVSVPRSPRPLVTPRWAIAAPGSSGQRGEAVCRKRETGCGRTDAERDGWGRGKRKAAPVTIDAAPQVGGLRGPRTGRERGPARFGGR